MAYKVFDDFSADQGAEHNAPITLHINGQTSLDLPDASFVKDAEIVRDGMDLVLNSPHGNIVIENYFNADPQPDLVAPGGETLTPELVGSFAHSPAQYAQNLAMNDASHVGAVQEVSGNATVTHMDGSVETITIGTKIFQGDVIETDAAGAVNIVFIDETSFAVSEDARLAIDEYVFDPDTQAGSSNFSVLKGVFVFTSGLIGRDDPDDVQIDTPVGSIGIRGTIIMGDVNSGEITVVEGAIVLKDFQGHEVTLATQFETAKFVPGATIEEIGVLDANDVGNKFASIAKVSPTLFSSLEDAATEDPSLLVASNTAETPEETAEDAPLTNEQSPVQETVVADASQPTEQQAAPLTVMDTTLEAPLPPPPLPGANTFTGTTSGFDSKLTTLATTSGSILPPPPPPAGSTGTISTATNNTLPPPPPPSTTSGDGTLPPPLAVSVQTFGIPENYSGGPLLVARLFGQFAQTVIYNLIDPDGAYQMLNYDGMSVEIWTQSGVANFLDREGGDLMPVLGFTARNGSGSATINGPINVMVTNVNENPILMGLSDTGIPEAYFQAAEGTQFSLNLYHLFKDVDAGDSLTFRLTSTSLAELQALNPAYLNGSNIMADGRIAGNILSIDFNNNFSALPDDSFTFEIEAVDAGGLTSGSFLANFEVLNGNIMSVMTMASTANGIYSDTVQQDNTVTVTNDFNRIFTNGGNDLIYISDGTNDGNGNEVHAGAGNDTFVVRGTGSSANILLGGDGNDTFDIRDGQVGNEFYGLAGNDTFILDAASVTQFVNNPVPGIIDGGQGLNTLRLSGAGSLDFDAIFDTHSNTIQNISNLNTVNANNNAIQIDFSDVLELSGHDRTLRIERDAGDTVQIDTEGNTWTMNNDGNGNEVYTINDGLGTSVTIIVQDVGTAVSVV